MKGFKTELSLAVLLLWPDFFPPLIPALSEGHECYFSQTLEFITDDKIYTGDKISFTVIIAWGL